ncbi:MGMT family protein [Kaarinaea lacus]
MNKVTENFQQRCYELLMQIPKGKVTTYQEMAKALKSRAWRAVGTAMAKNPNLISVPCHRVVRSNGEIGEYALGTEKKAELLTAEGVHVRNRKVIDLDSVIHRF